MLSLFQQIQLYNYCPFIALQKSLRFATGHGYALESEVLQEGGCTTPGVLWHVLSLLAADV